MAVLSQKSNLVVAVSGASSGLGLAGCQALSQRGYRVVGGARRFPKEGLGFDTLSLDVRDPGSIENFFKHIKDHYGRLDVLINCAGVSLVGPLQYTTDAEEQAVFNVNVFGMMRMCRAALPYLRQQPGSRIINVSSLAGFIGIPFHTTYCATKFAVEGLTESLQYELHPLGVHVSLLQPGDFLTEMTEKTDLVENASKGTEYLSYQKRAVEIMDADCRKSFDLKPFTNTLIKAVEARNPKLRYIGATRGQKIIAKATQFLPDAVISSFVRRFYRQN